MAESLSHMDELVKAVRRHASAHAELDRLDAPGWRVIAEAYTDAELKGVLLPGCATLPEALRQLAPVVAVFAAREAASASTATATEAPAEGGKPA
jgi:hypothetical protein